MSPWSSIHLGASRQCISPFFHGHIVLAATLFLPLQARTDITGIWRVDAKTDTKNGPREVIIRPDSSASWGKETVRWRLKGDKISIVLGGEWDTYKVKVMDNALTLSGGDLEKPVTLEGGRAAHVAAAEREDSRRSGPLNSG